MPKGGSVYEPTNQPTNVSIAPTLLEYHSIQSISQQKGVVEGGDSEGYADNWDGDCGAGD